MTPTLITQPPTGVVAASALQSNPATGWTLDALSGRFVEVTGASDTSALTAAAQIVLEAQQRGLFATWIGDARSLFFPPDFARSGIDLAALPVVRVPEAIDAYRAADMLLRSSGFAVVVLDWRTDTALSLGIQTRLAGLAQQFNAALLWITGRDRQGSRSSLVSLRVETSRQRIGFNRFTCQLRAAKDKRSAPGWQHNEVYRGPSGLC